jgi:hypothetical protein
LTKLCSSHVVVEQNGSSRPSTESNDVEVADIDGVSQENMTRTIIFYANQTLRTITLCYRDFPSWPPPGMQGTAIDDVGIFSVIFRHTHLVLGALRRHRLELNIDRNREADLDLVCLPDHRHPIIPLPWHHNFGLCRHVGECHHCPDSRLQCVCLRSDIQLGELTKAGPEAQHF